MKNLRANDRKQINDVRFFFLLWYNSSLPPSSAYNSHAHVSFIHYPINLGGEYI